MVNAPNARSALLAKVHVAKKQMALDDAGYRAILLRVTGYESAALAKQERLHALLAEFERLGWKPRRPHRRAISGKPHVRKVYALWIALKPHLTRAGAEHSDAALRAFVRRQTGVASPDWLDGAQANKVTEGLKAWLARRQDAGRRPEASGEQAQATEAASCPAS